MPRGLLAASLVIFVLAMLVEAFGVEAGAAIGNFFEIVVAATIVVGVIAAEPRWRLMLAAILCAFAAASALTAYPFAAIHISDPAGIDDAAQAFVALALVLGTLGVAVARDTPAGPRILFIVALVLKPIFPLTEIGTAGEAVGPYIVYALVLVLIVAWSWYGVEAARAKQTRPVASGA